MKTRPILFNGAMVRAILDGRKTQTRRIVKLPAFHEWGDGFDGQIMYSKDEKFGGFSVDELSCPIGRISDHLWVRETWGLNEPSPCMYDPIDDRDLPESSYIMASGGQDVLAYWKNRVVYRSSIKGNHTDREVKKWRPSIHMPRWASRIQLEITGVRVERLNDISSEDSIAEGIERVGGATSCCPWRNYRKGHTGEMDMHCSAPARSYMTLWESINGAGSWNANPWVWVIEFRMVAA